MKIVFILVLSICSVSQSITTLHCEYGVIPQAAILISDTDIKNESEIGQYTEVRYQGTPNQKLENVILVAEGNELYRFQLDSGASDENFLITVFKSETQTFKATVVNPKSPYMKKMNGECQLK